MQIRCYNCGMSFALGREEASFALQALRETDGNRYDAPCPRCRRMNRVSLEQLERISPPPSVEEEAEEPAEPKPS